ncbi:MAG: ABC transporter permease, partial [Psychromonas sp.]|nr:ABC transporter permease [Psychromonas sp.]
MSLVATWHNIRNNPVNANRWIQFKTNKRGYWSLWIFISLFVLSLFAELWINDKPIMISYQQH